MLRAGRHTVPILIKKKKKVHKHTLQTRSPFHSNSPSAHSAQTSTPGVSHCRKEPKRWRSMLTRPTPTCTSHSPTLSLANDWQPNWARRMWHVTICRRMRTNWNCIAGRLRRRWTLMWLWWKVARRYQRRRRHLRWISVLRCVVMAKWRVYVEEEAEKETQILKTKHFFFHYWFSGWIVWRRWMLFVDVSFVYAGRCHVRPAVVVRLAAGVQWIEFHMSCGQ